MLGLLDRILVGYISNNVNECMACSPAMSFAPHEFVQITWNHILVASFHPLNFCLASIPIGFHTLCVSPCCAVNEFYRMVDSLMQGNIGKGLDLVIRSPLVTVNDGTWLDVGLDYWK